MHARLNHVTKVTTITFEQEDIEKIRKFFETKLEYKWPDNVDDHSAVEDALREIVNDD